MKPERENNMKKYVEEIINVAENLDWSVHVNNSDFEFEKFSPAGQDFNFCVTASNLDNVTREIKERCDNFDPSEEAYLWLDDSGHGKNGAPYDMKDVYEDMEECQKMIQELYEELCKIEDDEM